MVDGNLCEKGNWKELSICVQLRTGSPVVTMEATDKEKLLSRKGWKNFVPTVRYCSLWVGSRISNNQWRVLPGSSLLLLARSMYYKRRVLGSWVLELYLLHIMRNYAHKIFRYIGKLFFLLIKKNIDQYMLSNIL